MFYKLVLLFIWADSQLGRFAFLFGLFLFNSLKRSPLRFFVDKKKNPQKSEANQLKLIYRTYLESLKIRSVLNFLGF